MARYHILHETRYDYDSPVSLSQQQLHLSPRVVPWQRLVEHNLQVDPDPSWQRFGQDAFGNPVVWLAFESPHDHLHVHSAITIDVVPHALTDELDQGIGWEEIRERLAYNAAAPRPEDIAATAFLFESPLVRLKSDFSSYAAPSFPPGAPMLAATRALMAQIHAEFTFDPDATTVSTPVLEVLEKRRGVCQDFAHLMIACLRSLGLAARYVSGYLLTHPPAGRPRLVGADASHAWVSVYCPGAPGDWVDFDPTNNLLPDTEHIAMAIGRDFGDVSPMRGVILGGGTHEPEVAVTVTPLDDEPATLVASDDPERVKG